MGKKLRNGKHRGSDPIRVDPIRVAIVGVGNCASALVQGLTYYQQPPRDGRPIPLGLMHYRIGPYRPTDLDVVAAFDIDARKVGQPLGSAIFAPPNCTTVFARPAPTSGPRVSKGPVLDGVAPHMNRYPATQRFMVSRQPAEDVERILRATQTDIAVSYLPVGAQRATEFYATCCLHAGVSVVNCVPVFIASEPTWAQRFARAGIPVIGDDIKSQLGATILHRTLMRLCEERGIHLERTYQLNTGGNTDFLNMLDRSRLASKKASKTEAVQSQLQVPLPSQQIHIGPSDYVPWQRDNKVCFLRIEGRGFGGVPMELELRLSVEDSPNSAGVAIDAIRLVQLARDRGVAGPLIEASAYLMKHPPRQMTDDAARVALEAFIHRLTRRRPLTAHSPSARLPSPSLL